MPAGPLPADEPDEVPRPDQPDDPRTTTPGAGPAVPEMSTPDPSPADVDSRWRDIVAQLGELAPPATPPVARPDDRGPGARTVRPAAADPGPRDWQPDAAATEADDHFVPPDPGPVLGGDPLLTLAWGAVVGVPVLVVLVALLWQDVPRVVLQVAGALFLAGVGLLVWRMPHRRDDDDPGAVV